MTVLKLYKYYELFNQLIANININENLFETTVNYYEKISGLY